MTPWKSFRWGPNGTPNTRFSSAEKQPIRAVIGAGESLVAANAGSHDRIGPLR
jgi:hypothetical protein